MLSGRGNFRSVASAARVVRPMWRAKLTAGAPFGSRARSRGWRSTAYLSDAPCRNTRQLDPVAAIGGLIFFGIMGLSAYGEWLAASWLISALSG
jgi:hypothetical protein